MAGEATQGLRPLQPMLEELRGQLDEVARDVGPRQQRIGDVRQHAMQRVAELMEQGVRLVEAQAGMVRPPRRGRSSSR